MRVDPISKTEDILQVFDFANFTILQTGFSLRKTWRNSKTCKISSVCEIENLEKCKVESLGITLRNRPKKLCEIEIGEIELKKLCEIKLKNFAK